MIKIGDRGFVRDVISFGRTIGCDHLVEPTDKVTAIIAKGGPEDGNFEGKYNLQKS